MPKQYLSDKYIKRRYDASIDNDLMRQASAREAQRESKAQQRQRDISLREKECSEYPEAKDTTIE